MANYLDNKKTTAFPEEDFEAELLALGGLDDDFDFTLDGSARFFDSKRSDNAFKRMFGGADDLDLMFTDDSNLSAPTDKQPNQCERMQVDSIQEKDSRKSSRRRSSKRKNQVELNVSNFDPAPYNPSDNPSSCSDLSKLEVSSTCSEPMNSRSRKVPRRRSTLDSPHAPCLVQLLGYGSNNGVKQESSPAKNTAQYQKTLQKLSQSMKRTELSRRQLTMMRTIHGNQQQLQQSQVPQIAITASAAQQCLQQRVSGGGFPSPTTVVSSSNYISSPQYEHFNDSNVADNDRVSIMAAFFSGSRGTLTNGLEQSRKRMNMYLQIML